MTQLIAQEGQAVSPMLWALVSAAIGFWMMIAARGKQVRILGQLFGVAGLVLIAAALFSVAPFPTWTEQGVFWLLASVAVVGAASAVASRSPVYTAIWFAFSLLGVAGLFVLQHAQFLGVATIVVYAGAIVVTFLFVLMLAQPAGTSSYDRLSWGRMAVPSAVIIATTLTATIIVPQDAASLLPAGRGVELTHPDHMARLGAELFSRHLIGVEVVGTLLLVALVGAVSIIIHGRSSPETNHSDQSPSAAPIPGGGVDR